MPDLQISQSSQVRLVPLDQPGATLYNCYQYLSQIAGMYTHAARADGDSSHESDWFWLCDSVVEDLGVLYTAWEHAIKVVPGGTASKIPLHFAERVVRTCLRSDVLGRNLGLWTPAPRVLRLLLLCERRWQTFLTALTQPAAALPVKLTPLVDACAVRLGRLEKLKERSLAESERINTCFALVAQGNL